MICSNCGNKEAYCIRGGYDSKTKTHYESCDVCGNQRVVAMPDVSDVHEPYFDEHLADSKHPDGQWITSRYQKAAILRSLNLREKRESTIKYIKDPVERQRYFKDSFGG